MILQLDALWYDAFIFDASHEKDACLRVPVCTYLPLQTCTRRHALVTQQVRNKPTSAKKTRCGEYYVAAAPDELAGSTLAMSFSRCLRALVTLQRRRRTVECVGDDYTMHAATSNSCAVGLQKDIFAVQLANMTHFAAKYKYACCRIFRTRELTSAHA